MASHRRFLDVPQSSSASTITKFTGNSGPTMGSSALTYPITTILDRSTHAPWCTRIRAPCGVRVARALIGTGNRAQVLHSVDEIADRPMHALRPYVWEVLVAVAAETHAAFSRMLPGVLLLRRC